jgi:hypothetical protein
MICRPASSKQLEVVFNVSEFVTKGFPLLKQGQTFLPFLLFLRAPMKMRMR